MNFKDRVLKLANQIPYGKVTTYGTLAALAGVPRGARLVGGALHFSGESQVPWHRVINRYGYISIKCFDHPKELQKALLESEGIEVGKDFMVDLSRYGWWGVK